MTGHPSETLTAFQIEAARLFFSLPTSGSFLLAGGAALLAQGLTSRPTQDLDLFTRQTGDVAKARDAFEAAAASRAWRVERVRLGDDFCRLVIHGPEDLIVDLALEAPPSMPATVSILGPTFAPDELAGRKLLALFDRAAARDFADVFQLSERYDQPTLFRLAHDLDAGVEPHALAGMIDYLGRYADADIPIDGQQATELRRFFAEWAATLRSHAWRADITERSASRSPSTPLQRTPSPTRRTPAARPPARWRMTDRPPTRSGWMPQVSAAARPGPARTARHAGA